MFIISLKCFLASISLEGKHVLFMTEKIKKIKYAFDLSPFPFPFPYLRTLSTLTHIFSRRLHALHRGDNEGFFLLLPSLLPLPLLLTNNNPPMLMAKLCLSKAHPTPRSGLNSQERGRKGVVVVAR